MATTNVAPEQLNYVLHSTELYDVDIRNAVVPGHTDLHGHLVEIIKKECANKNPRVLELGIGTGLTALRILESITISEYQGIDFSEHMLNGARKRLEKYNPKLLLGDFSEVEFQGSFDIVTSVIAIHHQTNEGKRRLFKKINDVLNPGGIFLLGDLVTYRDQSETAFNEAYHIAHLVRNARSEQALREWAYHQKFLNIPAPLEDQVDWLKEAGFKEVSIPFRKYTTALIYAKK